MFFQECAITTFNKCHVNSYSCIHILCRHIDKDVIKVKLNKTEYTFIGYMHFLSQLVCCVIVSLPFIFK